MDHAHTHPECVFCTQSKVFILNRTWLQMHAAHFSDDKWQFTDMDALQLCKHANSHMAVHTHTHTHTHACACTQTHTCTHIQAHMHIYIYMHTRSQAHVCRHMDVCTHVHKHTQTITPWMLSIARRNNSWCCHEHPILGGKQGPHHLTN